MNIAITHLETCACLRSDYVCVFKVTVASQFFSEFFREYDKLYRLLSSIGFSL